MRAFLIIGHKFRGEINLNDLPGSGRIDVIARCINSAIFLSHDIRRDVMFFAHFPRISATLRIDSSEVKYLNPDERSTAALIRNAIVQMECDKVRTSPGFYIRRATLKETLREVSKYGEVFYLHEDGEDIRSTDIPENAVFVLSDSVNPDEEEERLIREFSSKAISLGPRSLLASHAITVVHNEMDRRGL